MITSNIATIAGLRLIARSSGGGSNNGKDGDCLVCVIISALSLLIIISLLGWLIFAIFNQKEYKLEEQRKEVFVISTVSKAKSKKYVHLTKNGTIFKVSVSNSCYNNIIIDNKINKSFELLVNYYSNDKDKEIEQRIQNAEEVICINS